MTNFEGGMKIVGSSAMMCMFFGSSLTFFFVSCRAVVMRCGSFGLVVLFGNAIWPVCVRISAARSMSSTFGLSVVCVSVISMVDLRPFLLLGGSRWDRFFGCIV